MGTLDGCEEGGGGGGGGGVVGYSLGEGVFRVGMYVGGCEVVGYTVGVLVICCTGTVGLIVGNSEGLCVDRQEG